MPAPDELNTSYQPDSGQIQPEVFNPNNYARLFVDQVCGVFDSIPFNSRQPWMQTLFKLHPSQFQQVMNEVRELGIKQERLEKRSLLARVVELLKTKFVAKVEQALFSGVVSLASNATLESDGTTMIPLDSNPVLIELIADALFEVKSMCTTAATFFELGYQDARVANERSQAQELD